VFSLGTDLQRSVPKTGTFSVNSMKKDFNGVSKWFSLAQGLLLL
jgi:hypothetical protein